MSFFVSSYLVKFYCLRLLLLMLSYKRRSIYKNLLQNRLSPTGRRLSYISLCVYRVRAHCVNKENFKYHE